jgi:hypothetical protein
MPSVSVICLRMHFFHTCCLDIRALPMSHDPNELVSESDTVSLKIRIKLVITSIWYISVSKDNSVIKVTVYILVT